MDHLFHYNPRKDRWERIDRVQEYRGVKIESITWYREIGFERQKNHRDYQLTWQDGKTSRFFMNRRNTLKDMKEYIDLRIDN